MTKDERKKRIAEYAAGFDQVKAALEGFPESKLGAHPIAGKWSAKEIVHHLADSETTAGIRLRRLLVEDRPAIQGYDQDAFAAKLFYGDREIGPSLDAFRAARATTLQILERMSEADWTREGTHSESGRYSVEQWLAIYAEHAHKHAGQIRRLRDLVG